MSQKNTSAFVGVLLLTAATLWICLNSFSYDVPEEGFDETTPWWASLLPWQGDQERSIRIHQGLDLVGGSQVVLEAEKEFLEDLDPDELRDRLGVARVVIENRVSGGLALLTHLYSWGVITVLLWNSPKLVILTKRSVF